jgi:hypothetical protein
LDLASGPLFHFVAKCSRSLLFGPERSKMRIHPFLSSWWAGISVEPPPSSHRGFLPRALNTAAVALSLIFIILQISRVDSHPWCVPDGTPNIVRHVDAQQKPRFCGPAPASFIRG